MLVNYDYLCDMEKVLELYKYIDGVNDTKFPSNEEQLIVGEFRYDAKRMGGAPTISFTAMHRLCLDDLWSKNVYATFNGERYYIRQTPTSSYSNADARYKHEVELVSERMILDNIYFYDVVQENSNVDKPVSNSSKFAFFGDVEEYVARLNASLSWSNVDYNVVIDEGIVSEEKQVSFENQVITTALQEIYNIYQIPYYFVGKTIHVGTYQESIDHLFKYGVENSLLSISKDNANAKIINRITGIGSQDNIPYYYPNDDEKGVTRPLLNGSTSGVEIVDSSKYRKVRLSDTFNFSSTLQTSTPLLDVSKYTLGDLRYDFFKDDKAQYSLDFYYSFTLNQGENVEFVVETTYQDSVELRYEIYKTSGRHLGYFSGMNNLSLTGGTYNLIIRWKFLYEDSLISLEEYLPTLLEEYLQVGAYVVVDAQNQWTLNSMPVSLSNYGLSVSNPTNGDVISIQQTSYINTQPFLMPSIYRSTWGDERFYNAENNTYKDKNGVYYTFDNEYSSLNPREHIENFDDIRPTIKNVTNSAGDYIDRFVDFAYDLYDNDDVDEEGKYVHKYFFAKLNKFDGDNGFNLFDHAIDESEMVISMTSGSCGSCSFKIMVNKETQKNTVQVDEYGNLLRDSSGNVRFGSPQEKQNDTINNQVWIALEKDAQTFGVLMPNASKEYRPIAGDTFVILHIDLPKAYIIAAEKRLEEELIKYMFENNFEKFNFSISFSRIFFAEHPEILQKVSENSKLQVEYNGTTYDLFVSSLSYSMTSDHPLPEIKVELDDAITISQNQISQIVESTKKEIISSTKKDVFWGDIKGIPSWITREKPKYSYSELSGATNATDGLWVVKSDVTGEPYIYTTFNVVTEKGITMYANNTTLDLPSIYAGIPFDNKTVWLNPETGLVEVLGGTGGGSGEGVSNFWDLSNIPSWITATKPKYNYSEIEGTPDLSVYATETYVEDRLDDLINGAPAAYDTLKEIADVLAGNVNSIGDIITTLGTKADKAIKISAGTGLSGGGTLEADRTLSLATSGVTAGTYKSVTVDKYGRVTEGTNPTTLAGYGITDAYTKTNVDDLLKLYVTLAGTQTITGEKNFTGGLNVNGSPIVYDATNKYWKLEGDLLVTGVVTMYANEGTYSPSTIMDAITTDNVNLKVVNGVLTFVGETGGGVVDSVDWENIDGKPSWIGSVKPIYTFSEIGSKPTTLSGYGITDAKISNGVITLGGNTITPLTQENGDARYLKLTGGTIEGTLQIKRSASVIKYLDAEGESYGWLGFNAVDTPVMYTSTSSRSIKLLHAENYNTYVPKLDGTGAKGVWGIDISGEASKVKCTAGTADTYRPVVVTVPDAATQNLYYGEKVLANYATGDLKVSSTTVDGIRIYKSSTGVLRIDGDVVLSGALTMYGTDSVNTSTIMDGVVVDGTTIMNDGKKLYLNPNLELGGLDEDELNSYLTSNKYLTQTTGDARYVTAIGTSGNYLTYTKNGVTQDLTVPYATNADKLDGIHSTGFYKSNAGSLESDELETFINRDSGGYSVTYRSASTGAVSYSGMFSVLKSGAGSVQAIELIANNYTLKQGALQVRLNVDGTRYSATKTIAFSDGNVATADTASKLSTVSKTAWGQTYWTSGGVPTDISGNMTGVGNITMSGSINSAVTINSGDDSSWIKGSGHNMYFGGTGYANQSYYFRPLYGASGATTSNLYIQNASASSSPTFTTTHSFLSNGNASHAGTLTINGIKLSKSKDDVLFIDANLVVRGAVTMYGTNSVTASTIMDGILVDDSTIIKDPTTKKLMINPDLELGGGLDETALASYLSSWVGSSSIKNVGTITSGTWNGSKIANAYLANSAVTISGKSVSLGGSLSQADLRTALGLGSNAYTSTSYLPLAGGTMTNTTVVTNLNADLLDGYHVNRFPLLNSVYGSSSDLDNADRAGYYKVSLSANLPSGFYEDGMLETIEVHTGVSDTESRTLQVYYPHLVSSSYNYYGMAQRTRNGGSWSTWKYFVTKDGNVASATKLQTSRTIWGQSFDGTASVSGNMTGVGSITMSGALSGATTGAFSSTLSGNEVVITNSGGTTSGHLRFSRANANYIAIPTGGTLAVNLDGSMNVAGSDLIVRDGAVYPGTSGSTSLGRDGNLWNGLYLYGGSTSGAFNKFGINFGADVARISANPSGGLGIYAIGDLSKIYLRAGCTTTGASSTGLVVDADGNVEITGNLLVQGGITMYGTGENTSGITSDLIPETTATYNLGNEDGRWLGVYSNTGNFSGAITMSGTTGSDCSISFTRTHSYIMFNTSINFASGTATGTDTIMRISSNGYVGINTYQPTVALDVVGSIKASGTVTQGSDIRYKDIHKDILLSLATMAEAPSIEFHFKDDEQKSTHIGTSAQYWQSVSGVVTEDSEGRLGMDYSSLGVVMGISLAKELSRFESDTDRRIRLLEEENKRLKEEIEQLKMA